jgi:hypothetical protein
MRRELINTLLDLHQANGGDSELTEVAFDMFEETTLFSQKSNMLPEQILTTCVITVVHLLSYI